MKIGDATKIHVKENKCVLFLSLQKQATGVD